MSVETVLTAFAQRNRMEAPPPKADGSRVLVFDGRYKITFRDEDHRTIRASARISSVPADDNQRRDFMEDVLATATARMKDHHEIIHLSDDGRTLHLFRRAPADLPPPDVDSLLTGLVNSLAFWQRITADTASRAAPAPSPFQMMFR